MDLASTMTTKSGSQVLSETENDLRSNPYVASRQSGRKLFISSCDRRTRQRLVMCRCTTARGTSTKERRHHGGGILGLELPETETVPIHF